MDHAMMIVGHDLGPRRQVEDIAVALRVEEPAHSTAAAPSDAVCVRLMTVVT